ncbi:hypothetical protein VTK26DRAFT_7431 [Humicola hyalothermophila]
MAGPSVRITSELQIAAVDTCSSQALRLSEVQCGQVDLEFWRRGQMPRLARAASQQDKRSVRKTPYQFQFPPTFRHYTSFAEMHTRAADWRQPGLGQKI